jgi:CheY-like chemotaxis protein
MREAKPLIAVVDDNADFRGFVELVLSMEGFEPVTYRNGGTAFEQMRDLPPSLAIIDYLLPDFDGLQLIDLLRRTPATAHVPIVLTTAISAPYAGPIVRAAQARGADVLFKPFQVEALASVIRRQLAVG